MSDPTSPSFLSEIESLASGLVPGLGSAATIAKLADDGLGLISQPIKSAQIDKPENEAKDRTAQYENILAENDPNKLSDDLGTFISKLFLDANIATGELSGRTRRIPVEHLNAFILATIQLIELREQAQVIAAK